MFLKSVKMIFAVSAVLLAARAAAYATDFTVGEIKFQGLYPKGSYSCLPGISLSSNGDFSDLKVRLFVSPILAATTLGSLNVEVDTYRMPFTAAFDGSNTVVLDILNLRPGTSHTTKIDGLRVDLTSLAPNSPVTGSIGVSGTNINPANFSAFYGITRQSGGEGSAVLSNDITQAIGPKTFVNNKFYDLSYSIDAKLNFNLKSALGYNFVRDVNASNFIWQAGDGYYTTFSNLSFGSNLYHVTAKYDVTLPGVSFAPVYGGIGIPASDSNASGFAAATSVVGHMLNQLTGFYSGVLDLSQSVDSDQTTPCPQAGTWGITFYSPTSIQNTFTGCQGLFQNITVDGEFWLWTNNGTWSTNNFRVQGPAVGGSYDITYKNIFAVGTQMGTTYTGTLSGAATGLILNGSNSVSADHTFANVNFTNASDQTATTLNVQSGWVYSNCMNTWYAPVIYNWQNDSQGPISGTFSINSMNGGSIIGAAFSSGGANSVTSGTAVVETHPTGADLERFCLSSAMPSSGFKDGTYSLNCLGGCGESNPSIVTVTGSGSNLMWNNFGGSIARFLATGSTATLTGPPPPLFGTPATSLTINLNGLGWTINGSDATGSCTSTCQSQ